MTNTNHNHKSIHSDVKIEKGEKSKVKITASIAWEHLNHFKDHVLSDMQKDVEIDGFRKGKVPLDMLVKRFGMQSILEESAEHAINIAYREIITENNLDVIGRPEVAILKIAENNPLEFKIETYLVPEVSLPEYKNIAKKENEKSSKEKIEVSDEEVKTAINDARKNLALSKNTPTPTDGFSTEKKDIKIEDLPVLTDESVKEFGNFTSLKDLEEKVKAGMKREKELKARDKNRLAIVEKIVSESKIEIPEILIESELGKIEATFQNDLARMGMKEEDYLKHIKKSKEDLMKDWKPDAEKKAKVQLILNKIALDEKIVPDEAEVEKEIEAVIKYYKDADPVRARIYVETLLTNDMVFEFLEKQS